MPRILVLFLLWSTCLLYGNPVLAQTVRSVAEAAELIHQGRRCQETQDFLQRPAGNTDPKVLLLRCQSLFDRKRYDDAEQACLQSIDNAGGQVGAAHRILGNVLSERINSVGVFGKMRLASRIQKELKLAADLDPKDGAARESLAQFYSQAPGIAGGSWTKAYEQEEQTARFDPALAHLITSNFKRTEKNDEAALQELHLAAQVGASSAVILSRVGSGLLDLGYSDEGHSYLLQAFQLDPRDPVISYQLARSNLVKTHASSAELDQAENLLTDYVARCPGAYRPDASEAQVLLGRLPSRRAEAAATRPPLAHKP